MNDFPSFSEDVDPLLARVRHPESLTLALQAVTRYRERMQELLAAARRAEAEQMERELRLNRFAGHSEEASRRIAFNDLAFFRAELSAELHEAVVQARARLKTTLERLAEEEEEI